MKKEVLEALDDAKLAHDSWKSYAHLIAKGVIDDNFEKKAPLVPTECQFGKWYFKDGSILSNFKEYQDIEVPHAQVHDIYAKIYKLIHTKVKTGFFQSQKRAEDKRDKKVDDLLALMDEQVDVLVRNLEKLKEKVSNLTDAQLYNATKN